MSSIEPTLTKQILFQQTPADDATMRAVAKLANVSNAEVIRQAMALGLPALLEQYGLTEADVERRRTEMYPALDMDAPANRGGIRLGNAEPKRAHSPKGPRTRA